MLFRWSIFIGSMATGLFFLNLFLLAANLLDWRISRKRVPNPAELECAKSAKAALLQTAAVEELPATDMIQPYIIALRNKAVPIGWHTYVNTRLTVNQCRLIDQFEAWRPLQADIDKRIAQESSDRRSVRLNIKVLTITSVPILACLVILLNSDSIFTLSL